jgi:hypothetical protein
MSASTLTCSAASTGEAAAEVQSHHALTRREAPRSADCGTRKMLRWQAEEAKARGQPWGPARTARRGRRGAAPIRGRTSSTQVNRTTAP